MTSKDFNMDRRKFMVMSSSAIAAPFVMNVTGMVPDAKAEEVDFYYVISDDCIGCHYCFYECPASAIHWGNDKYVIDQDKCIKCGTCAEVCNICAAHRRAVVTPKTYNTMRSG